MSTLAEVVFLSQAWAEAYAPRAHEALISITDRAAPPAQLRAGWSALLRIAFDDVDPVNYPVAPEENLVGLLQEQAERIARFVIDSGREARTLVIHCRYGQSRSAGVAKAVAEAFGLAFPADYADANQHVYESVLASLRQHGAVPPATA